MAWVNKATEKEPKFWIVHLKAKISVLADEFLAQWLEFIRAIMDALVELQPDLANDGSYQKYRSQLDVVASRK